MNPKTKEPTDREKEAYIKQLVQQFKNPRGMQYVLKFNSEILKKYDQGEEPENMYQYMTMGWLTTQDGYEIAKLMDGKNRLMDIVNLLAIKIEASIETVSDHVLIHVVFYDFMGMIKVVSVPEYVPLPKIRIQLTADQQQKIKEMFARDIEVYELEDPTGKIEEQIRNMSPSEVDYFILRQLRNTDF